MLERAVTSFVRRHLRGVWISRRPGPGPAVWAGNHHSWWDPFVGTAVSRAQGTPSAVLMLQANLDRFPFARLIGAFGTGEPRAGLRHLDKGSNLIVYPEGELCPPGPLRDLAVGAAWFAGVAEVPLYALAGRVVVRGQAYPEAYLAFERVDTAGPPGAVTKRLHAQLGALLSEIDDQISHADPSVALPGYTCAVAGRRSADERIANLSRRLTWRS